MGASEALCTRRAGSREPGAKQLPVHQMIVTLARCFAALHHFRRPIPGEMILVVGFAHKIFGKLAFVLDTMWFDQRWRHAGSGGDGLETA